MNTSDPSQDHQLLSDFAKTSRAIDETFAPHWSDRYARTMTCLLVAYYGTRAETTHTTGISMSILSQLINGSRYHISTSILARLEEAIDVMFEEKDNGPTTRKA